MKFYQMFNAVLGQNSSILETKMAQYYIEKLDFNKIAEKNNIDLSAEQIKIIEICKKLKENIDSAFVLKELSKDEENLILSLENDKDGKFGKKTIALWKEVCNFINLSFDEYKNYKNTKENNFYSRIHHILNKELVNILKNIYLDFKYNLYIYLFKEDIDFINLEITNSISFFND